MKKVVIIGAGMAGAIAYSALRHYNPLVLEISSKCDRMELHPAVMRLRNPAIAQFIGARYEEIVVQKAIYYNGRIYNEPNILFNNLYSMKLYKELGRRSLGQLGENVRYILPDGYPAPENTEWGVRVKKISRGTIYYDSRYESEIMHMAYDYCISTLPMTKMVRDICVPDRAIFLGDQFKSIPVHVLHLSLPFPSTIHQTIYFPSQETSIYRITISGRRVIVEAIDEFQSGEAADLIQEAFGIGVDCSGMKRYTMPIGKMMAMNEDQRCNYIMWLTSEHKVFSFGRFSVWRPLRTDQLMDDMEKIKRWISATDIENQYRSRLMEDNYKISQ